MDPLTSIMIVFDKYHEFQSIFVAAQQERSPQIDRPLSSCLDSKNKVTYYKWELQLWNWFVCRNPGSNQGPLDLQSNALPTELFRLKHLVKQLIRYGENVLFWQKWKWSTIFTSPGIKVIVGKETINKYHVCIIQIHVKIT